MTSAKMLCALAILATAVPASATAPDPVLASFERLLDHRPSAVPAPAPAGFPADPLVAAVREALWRPTATPPASVAMDDVELDMGCGEGRR